MQNSGCDGNKKAKISKNLCKSSCLKPEVSGLSPKIVQIIALGSKMARPRAHMFYIDPYRENPLKIFLSETRKPRSLIFRM